MAQATGVRVSQEEATHPMALRPWKLSVLLVPLMASTYECPESRADVEDFCSEQADMEECLERCLQ